MTPEPMLPADARLFLRTVQQFPPRRGGAVSAFAGQVCKVVGVAVIGSVMLFGLFVVVVSL
jgi:hypothetical protein